MSYWVNHLMGASSMEFPIDSLPSLYSELSNSDAENTDVYLTHETEWCLSAFSSGLLIWENVAGEGDPKHMKATPEEKVIELWTKLSKGNIALIDEESWLPGYGS